MSSSPSPISTARRVRYTLAPNLRPEFLDAVSSSEQQAAFLPFGTFQDLLKCPTGKLNGSLESSTTPGLACRSKQENFGRLDVSIAVAVRVPLISNIKEGGGGDDKSTMGQKQDAGAFGESMFPALNGGGTSFAGRPKGIKDRGADPNA